MRKKFMKLKTLQYTKKTYTKAITHTVYLVIRINFYINLK